MSTKPKFKKVDPNVKITNAITKNAKETGLLPWMKPWDMVHGCSPVNFVSGREYQGFFNSMLLSMVANGRLPLFSPFTPATPAKKGEKSSYIWQPKTWIDKTHLKHTGEKKTIFGGFRALPVFHYTQLQNVDMEALEAKYAPESNGNVLMFNPIPECEAVINAMPNAPTIDNNGGNAAYYAPAKDSISIPPKEQFHSESEYYQTLFHELGHSTGHFTRLDRFKKLKIEFKTHKQGYSFEELVAELTSCYVASACGILEERRVENSAAYVKGWMSKLQSNTDWIASASSYATKASKYILNKTEEAPA